MQVIFHFLICICLAIGFIIFFNLQLRSKTFIILFLFLSGAGIGMYEHLTFADEHDYDKEVYDSLVVRVEPRNPNPWRQALCLVIHNNNICCPNVYDPRWQQPGYFGEC